MIREVGGFEAGGTRKNPSASIKRCRGISFLFIKPVAGLAAEGISLALIKVHPVAHALDEILIGRGLRHQRKQLIRRVGGIGG